jgi:hypothetical protein
MTQIPGQFGREDATTVIASKTLGVTTVKTLAADFGFSAAQLAAADVVVVSTFTNNANVLWDGSTPTATFGHPLTAGLTILSFSGNAKINLLQVVSQTGTTNVTVTLEKY